MFAAMYYGRNSFCDFAATPENTCIFPTCPIVHSVLQPADQCTHVLILPLSASRSSFGDCSVFMYLLGALSTFADEVTSFLKGLVLDRGQQN